MIQSLFHAKKVSCLIQKQKKYPQLWLCIIFCYFITMRNFPFDEYGASIFEQDQVGIEVKHVCTKDPLALINKVHILYVLTAGNLFPSDVYSHLNKFID